MTEPRRHRSGGPRPDASAPPLDLSGLGGQRATRAVIARADLPIRELVENERRSIAMLPPGAPALNRDDALDLLEQLAEALRRLKAVERDIH